MSFARKFAMLLSAVLGLLSINLIAENHQQQQAPIRVGFFAFDGYHKQDVRGVKSGYGYEFLQRLAPYVGWSYDYVGYDKSWAEMQDMLESGEIDVVTSAVKTPKRLELFDFSNRPLGVSFTIMSVKAGNKQYLAGDYKRWNGIRVGMLRQNTRNASFDSFAEEKDFSYTPVYFENNEDLVRALHSGAVDALVAGSLRRTSGEWVYEQFDPQPFYAIVKKGNTELLSNLNYALSRLENDDPLLANRLQSNYYSADQSKELSFTLDEMNFIEQAKAEKRVFRALLNPDRSPLSFVAKGKIQGVLQKLTARIVKRTGLDIQVMPLASRKDYRDAVADGELKIILDAWHNYSNAEANNLYLSSPYITLSISSLRLKSFSGTPRTIATVRDSDVLANLLNYDRSSAQVISYDTTKETIDAVKNGDVDSAWLYTHTAEEAIYNDNTGTLASVLMFGCSTSYAIGADRSINPLLISILEKAVRSVSEAEIEEVLLHTTIRPVRNISFRGYLMANPLKFILVAGSLFFIITLGLILIVIGRRKAFLNASIISRLPIRYFVFDRDGKILLSPGSILPDGKDLGRKIASIDDFKHLNIVDSVRKIIAEVLDSGSSQTFNYQTGSVKRTANISKLPTALFGTEAGVWVSQDTSELQNARSEAKMLAERFLLTLKSIGDGVIATDNEGRITLLNPIAEKMTGWTQQEAMGKTHEEVFRIESYIDNTPVESPVRRALRLNRAIELANHTDLISRKGARYHIADSAAPIHDFSGQVFGAILVFRDVTTEYNRRDEMNRLLTSLEYATELTESASFRYSFLLDELTGSELLPKLWPYVDGKPLPRQAWILPEDLSQFKHAFIGLRKKRSEDVVVDFRSNYYGPIRYYRIKASLDKADPKRQCIIGVLQDITEFVQSSTGLRDALEVQNALTENEKVINGCMEKILTAEDPLTTATQTVEAICKRLGADRGCICNFEDDKMVRLVEYLKSDNMVPLMDNFAKEFDKNSRWYQQLAAGQSLFIPNVTAETIASYNMDEKVSILKSKSIYMTGVFSDGILKSFFGISFEQTEHCLDAREQAFLMAGVHIIELLRERYSSREQILSAMRKAQEADKAKSFFLASMSHEIRTPLNAVIGFSELLKDGTMPPGEQKEYLNAISSAGNALLTLINDVLDLSKLEAGQMAFIPTESDFRELIMDVRNIFRRTCEMRQLELKTEIPPLPRVFIDRQRLRQILFNLVGNAVKFTELGMVGVDAKFTKETADTGSLTFSVTDTGTGISQEDQKCLFQPFVQLNAVRGPHSTNNGTGLGLVIVQRMLERMNGEISLFSEVGLGSKFTVTLHNLRYTETVTPDSTENRTSSPDTLKPCSILIVDDIPINLNVMKAMLKKLGVAAETASGGEEALKKLEETKFDYILTDLWMPGMNGAELARRIRRNNKFKDIKLVAVTADIESRESFNMSFFDTIMTKPVSVSKLQEVLRSL